ncbi:MAG: GNAT family N-acetyltransferase [Traorella sp.]
MQPCVLNQVILPDDIPFLYNAMSADDQYLFSTKLRFWSIQAFEQWLISRLKNDFHDFFIIKDKNNRKIGYAYNYDFSLQHGHCKLVVYIEPEYRKIGIGAFAAIRFISYLFETYPLLKLYSTIYTYNQESRKSNLAAGFVEEGVLKEYRYYDGQMHDLHYLSLSRQSYEQKIKGKWVK